MKKTLTLASLLTICSLGANAQTTAGPKVEPGLWEIHIAIKSQSGKAEAAMKQAREQIARLPPDQRKAVEEMMASQGVQLGETGSAVKACISKEDAARGLVPQQAGDCTQEVTERSSNAMKLRFACTSTPPAKGEASVSFQGPTAYTSQAVVDTEVLGAPERVDVNQTGRWIGPDCGSVKGLGG